MSVSTIDAHGLRIMGEGPEAFRNFPIGLGFLRRSGFIGLSLIIFLLTSFFLGRVLFYRAHPLPPSHEQLWIVATVKTFFKMKKKKKNVVVVVVARDEIVATILESVA